MIVKSIALAMMLFFGSLGIAGAQGPEPTALGGSQAASTAASTSATGPVTQALFLGWNYVHASACTGSNGVFWFLAQEGSNWFTTDTLVLIGLAPACQTGNFVGFHVFNLAGQWDQVYVFPFK